MSFGLRKQFYASTLMAVIACFAAEQVHAQVIAELIPFWDDREEASSLAVDSSRWQAILDKYLNDQHPSGINRFNYAAVTYQDKLSLETYLNYLQSLEPRQFNSREQMAYWINLYNSLTVSLILGEKRTNLRSIRQIRSGFVQVGPWKRKTLNVVQQPLSLDDIEHGILRPIWQDPRIHYVMHKASMGSPNLLKTAFTGDNIEDSLKSAAASFINHPRAVNIKDGRLVLSEIYSWYATDFGVDFQAVKLHLSEYANPELATRLRDFDSAKYAHDWSLNRP